VADQYAAQGYLSVAPALFDRQQKGVNLPYDQQGSERGMQFARNADPDGLKADLMAAVRCVAHAGAVGMVGYCWGGRIVYLAGSRANIAAGVVYYGGGITQILEPVPRCPMQFHFGEHDTHIPVSDVEKIRAAFPQGEYHLYDAGHGFNCTDRASYDAKAAHLAFERTARFLREHLG
jgi:carboxymethylenebutenolidase